jgi:hypothetical protein
VSETPISEGPTSDSTSDPLEAAMAVAFGPRTGTTKGIGGRASFLAPRWAMVPCLVLRELPDSTPGDPDGAVVTG